MELFFINNNKNKLILFLTGWGCDERQFQKLTSINYDILIGYDYSNLDINFNFSKYKEINLLTFSAGVFIAGLIVDRLPCFTKKIAINGNPLSYDKYYGLQENIIEKFKSISKNNIVDFRREYLVYSEEELKLLNSLQPHRSIESCIKELIALKKYYMTPFEPMKFDIVYLSDNDKILEFNRQKEYFANDNIRVIKNAGHFPFFRFNTYDEIIK